MNITEAEAAKAAGWFEHHLPGHHVSAELPAATTTTTEGHPMSLLDNLEAEIAEAKAKLGPLDEDAVKMITSLMSNPEVAPVVSGLATLAGMNLPPNVITEALGGVRSLLIAYAPATQGTGAQQPQSATQQ